MKPKDSEQASNADGKTLITSAEGLIWCETQGALQGRLIAKGERAVAKLDVL